VAPTGDPKKVHGNYHVKIEGIPGAEALLFSSANTPDLSLEVPKHKTWDQQGNTVNSAAGGKQMNVGPLTLTRGVDDNKDIYEWFKKTAEEGVDAQKKTLILTVLDAKGTPIETWNIPGAHVTQYSHSGHDANAGAILVASIQIECESAEIT
jgi:phage tail-like protein